MRSEIVLCMLVAILSAAGSLNADTLVRFDTALGVFDVQLFDTAAPNTVANFLSYVDDGSYDDTLFHRLVPGFVLQGGGHTWDDTAGTFGSVPAKAPIANEVGISNTRGTLAMAKLGGDPDSATCQFYFNLVDNSANLDSQNGGFTVFGAVVGGGMDIVDLLASQDTWDASIINPALSELPLIDYSVTEPLAGSHLELINSITVIPEPATLSLLAFGGLALLRRRK